MSAPPLPPNALGWKRWALGIAVIGFTGLLLELPAAFSREGPWPTQRFFAMMLAVPLFMVPLFATFNWAARRRLGSALTLLTSLAVAAVIGLALGVCFWCVLLRFPHLQPRPQRPLTLPRIAAFGVVSGVVLCAQWALAFVFPFAAEDARLRAVEAEKLRMEAEKLRSAAELARLRTQLEPHFMLNTLNAIAGLVTQDPREARHLIACLGDLLRDALRDGDEMQTLDAEIAWLRRYAEILEARHAGALCFSWEIEDRARDVLLPRLLLQPLVENAVKHGALCRDGNGEVRVGATVTTAPGEPLRLVCTVEDNGPGMPAGSPRVGAFGLRAVRRRIELRYADGSLELASSPDGTRAVVELPYLTSRTSIAAAAPEPSR